MSCSSYLSCSTCTPHSSCGWCRTTSRCLTGTSSGSGSCTGSNWNYYSSGCPSSSSVGLCSAYYNGSSCETCAGFLNCGFCPGNITYNNVSYRNGTCVTSTSSSICPSTFVLQSSYCTTTYVPASSSNSYPSSSSSNDDSFMSTYLWVIVAFVSVAQVWFCIKRIIQRHAEVSPTELHAADSETNPNYASSSAITKLEEQIAANPNTVPANQFQHGYPQAWGPQSHGPVVIVPPPAQLPVSLTVSDASRASQPASSIAAPSYVVAPVPAVPFAVTSPSFNSSIPAMNPSPFGVPVDFNSSPTSPFTSNFNQSSAFEPPPAYSEIQRLSSMDSSAATAAPFRAPYKPDAPPAYNF